MKANTKDRHSKGNLGYVLQFSIPFGRGRFSPKDQGMWGHSCLVLANDIVNGGLVSPT